MKNLRRSQCVLALTAGLALSAFWALNALSTLRPSGTWTSTASLSQARAGAAAALLDSGDILVTGGESATTILSSVERYGSGGVFSSAPAMTYSRRNHTITKLADGRLLVTGGITTGGAPTATAEVYSVATGSWSTAGGMSTARSGHTATLLSDGRVLIAGGSNGSTPTATLEVFDPVSNAFSVLPATMSSPRTGHGAATLWSGAVLLVGGSNGAAALETSDIFDPETNSVSPGASLSAARANLAVAALIDGKVLVAGGSSSSGELASAEVFDPAAGIFTPTGAMVAPRSGHSAFLLPQNGGVLIFGGSAPSTAVEIYQRWTGTFVATGSLSEARAQAAGSALADGEGRLLLAGGSGPLTSAELYNFATVTTDKDDYAPGQIVTISGSGWQPGETVTMLLQEAPKECNNRTLTAVADGSGTIVNTELLIEEHHVGVRFFLTATGQTSGQKAHMTFTDARTFTASISPTTTNVGVATPYTLTVTNTSVGSPLGPIGSVCVSIPSGMTVSASPAPGVVATDPGGAVRTWTATTLGAFRSASGGGAGDHDIDPPTGTIVISFTATATGAGPHEWTTIAASGNTSACNGTAFNISGSQPSVTATAPNSPPTIATNNATVTVNEGQTASNSGTWSDTNAGDTVTLSASVGTVIKAGTNAAGTWSWSYNTTDGPAQSQTVTITANDGNGGVTNTTFGLTVNNVAPTVNTPVVTPEPSNEGSSATASATFSDPAGALDQTYTCTVDYGDGGGPQTGSVAGTTCTGPAHVYGDNGSYTVTVAVTDKDGAPGSASTSHAVNNVAPSVGTPVVTPSPSNEGSSVSASATFTDPGASDGTFTCTVDYGDGAGDQPGTVSGGNTCTGPSHTYGDNGNFTVTVKVTDKDAGTGMASTSHTVLNVPPSVSTPVVTPSPSDEGSSVSASATFTDSGTADGPFTCAVDYGDGSGDIVGTVVGNTCTGPSHTYADNGAFSVTVKVTDKDSGTGMASTSHTVNNVNPTVGTPTVTPSPSDEGSSVTASASFTDPGTLDTFTCTVDYGDGSSPQNGNVVGNVCNGPSHTYADDGNFTVTVNVTDDDGGMGSNSIGHTVNNVVPVVTGPGNQTADEGTPKSFTLGSFTDPGADSPWKVVVNWGDGSTDSMFTVGAAGSLGSQNHTFADDGNYTVTVTVTEDNGAGAFDSETFSVAVANISPDVTPAANQMADEGTSKAFSLGSFTDPGDDDPWAVTVNWGDGSPNTTFNASAAGSLGTQNHTYADNGTYTVTVTVREDNGTGAADSATFDVVVANVAPIVTLNGPTTANEGQTKNYTFTVNDPGADTYALTAGFPTCGTGGTVVTGSFMVTGNTGSQTGGFSCSFPDGPASTTVQVKFTDDDGGTSSNGSIDVLVSNVNPTATFPTSATVNEGSSATFSFSGQSDPSAPDTATGFRYAYSCDGSALGSTPYSGASPSASVICSFPNGPLVVPVKARIIDKDDGYTEYTLSVTVLNLPPVITDLLGLPSGPVQKNTTPLLVNLTANFTDPGTLDTHMCTINWDNGAGPVNGTVAEAAGSGTCTGSNSVNIVSPGVYTITVVVTDNSGAYAMRTDFIVVYDPDGGFVTGGGWIQSPAGAYKPDMTLGGKANFGFVSKYKKGQSTPDGETQFQLHFADFNFHSTAYDWLVVAGAKAQYKGVGKLNGMFGSNNTSGYGFLLTATDGDLNGGGGADKFRIKIWDKATGDTIVYDNVNAPDDIDSANPQVISGGSIVIHSGGNGKK